MFGRKKLKREIEALKERIKVLEFINRDNLYEIKYVEKYSGDYIAMSMDYYVEISFLNKDKTKIITKRLLYDGLSHYKVDGTYIKEYKGGKVLRTYKIVDEDIIEI